MLMLRLGRHSYIYEAGPGYYERQGKGGINGFTVPQTLKTWTVMKTFLAFARLWFGTKD